MVQLLTADHSGGHYDRTYVHQSLSPRHHHILTKFFYLNYLSYLVSSLFLLYFFSISSLFLLIFISHSRLAPTTYLTNMFSDCEYCLCGGVKSCHSVAFLQYSLSFSPSYLEEKNILNSGLYSTLQ